MSPRLRSWSKRDAGGTDDARHGRGSLEAALTELLGKEHQVRLQLVHDGSGLGAALLAASEARKYSQPPVEVRARGTHDDAAAHN